MTGGQVGALVGALALLVSACSSRTPEAAAPTPDPVSLRTVAQGQVTGLGHDVGAHEWRNIPFAAPPVGALRWRAPRPAAAWDGVRESYAQPEWCVQRTNRLDMAYDLDAGTVAGSEDCLYLNVTAPAMSAAEAADASLPVMVWIHGGGNVWGRAEQYRTQTLSARENVIVVTPQYRLGSLGWFAHPALRQTAPTPDDATANFALLDMIAALEWVRENAAAFGGDPARVTVFGESAGGHNVASLLASPRAAGLFHRAIIQSGSFESVTLEEAEDGSELQPNGANAVVAGVLSARGQAPDFALADGPQDVVDALHGFGVDEIFAAYGLGEDDFVDPPRVIADGVTLPQAGLLTPLVTPAGFNAVPVMTGANRDETKLFNLLDERFATATFGLLYRARDADFYESVSHHQSWMWNVDAVDTPATLMTAGGHADVFAYRFEWDEQSRVLWSDFSQLLGAAHGLEIPFVFGDFNFLGRGDAVVFTKDNEEPRRALSDAMMRHWANFARDGDPGAVNGLAWERWSPSAPQRIIFDTAADGGVRMEPGATTPDEVMASLAADARLADGAERCAALEHMIEWRDTLNAQRADFADGACGAAGAAQEGASLGGTR